MAAKENQGLVFSLIMLVTLSLMLLVACFLIFRNYQEASTKLQAQTQERGTAEQNLQTAVNELQEIKQNVIGMANASASLDEVRSQLVQQLARFGGSAPPPPAEGGQAGPAGAATYAGLVESLSTKLISIQGVLANTEANLRAKEAQLAQETKGYNDALAEVRANFEKYKSMYEDVRTKFDQQFATSQSQASDLLTKSQNFQKQIEAKEAELGGQISNLEKQLASLRDIHEETLIQIDEKRQDNTDVPDGEVRWVGVRGSRRTAYVNIGSADALPARATFSVYGPGSQGSAAATRKGKLIVEEILGPHLAAATITDEDVRRPVSISDEIYSPTWRPGAAQHVAIAGMIDFDKDGTSDLPQLLDLIAASGGIVDAIVDEKGQSPEGKGVENMTIDTRFLVLGDKPAITQDTAEAALQSATAYSTMLERARVLSIRRMSVNEFLDYMGFKKTTDVRQYGQRRQNAAPTGSAATYRRISSF